MVFKKLVLVSQVQRITQSIIIVLESLDNHVKHKPHKMFAMTVLFMVLASRASGCLFGHPNPSKALLRTPKKSCEEFLKMSIPSI